MAPPATVLERESELELLDRALEAAAEGRGSAVLLAGPPGAGKTTLLDAAVARGRALGMRPLLARASPLEQGFPFGVVRQLLEARAGVGALPLGGGHDGDTHAVIHALYWVTADLTDPGPLLVAVDDLHWADDASLRFLSYLARRMEGLPIAVVATTRSGEAAPGLAAIEQALARTGLRRAEPAPLSPGAVASVLREALGEEPSPSFADACHERTGGNPFLVAELAAALRLGAVRPVQERLDAVRTALPEAVGDAVRLRLASLGSEADALAGAVAVLGDRADLPLAAALAGLSAPDAAAAAERLAAAAVLADAHPLRFRHPLLRAAAYADLPAIRRATAHGRAARLLAERDAPPGLVASHLLASPPGAGDPWAVDQLRRAARTARAEGVPDRAVAWLARAVEEPPPSGARGPLLSELGSAAVAALMPEASGYLREALALEASPGRRADLALELAVALYYSGAHAESVAVLVAAIDEAEAAGLREEGLRLEAFLGIAGRYDLGTESALRGRIQRVAAGVSGASAGERLVRSVAALESPGRTAEGLAEAARLAEEVADELPRPDPAEGVGTVAMYLFAGRPDRAAALADRMLAGARERGAPMRHAICLATRGMVALDVGQVGEAVADLGAAADSIAELGGLSLEPTVGYLVLALVETGDLDRAEALMVAHALDGVIAPRMLLNPALHARGVLRAAQHRFAEAVADQLELGRRHGEWGMTRPGPPWRSQAALALLADGDAHRARELAAEELDVATAWGAPKPVAIAARALALVEGGDEAIARLADVVRRLEGTPWRLERARARCDLGAALRRAGRRRDAREALSRAMDEAYAGGAAALATRAVQELRAAGARPRRRAVTGVEALTPAERRVVDLAVAGFTNRGIAQELFVTVATVETHLGRAYRKLRIEGRPDLAAALDRG